MGFFKKRTVLFSERAPAPPSPSNTIQQAFAKAVPYSAGDLKKLKCDQRLAEFVGADLQPYTVGQGFLRLMNALDPR